MPQINAGEFRKGIKVVIEGEPYDMLECNFVKPGKGQALYKCRLRNLLKNTIIDRTYKSGDGLEEILLAGKVMVDGAGRHARILGDATDRFPGPGGILRSNRSIFVCDFEDRGGRE